jgi:transposase-like protein
MSNIQIHKKGGPYTKQEQEKRRKQVYKLYFEEAKPVIKIAEMLDVNRNTINEDLKYWYSQLALEINSETVVSSALKQIHNMELQKTRLREQLENTTEFSQRLAIEKLLFEIDSKLAQHITKIMSSGKELLRPAEIEVPEDDIKKLVRDLVLENKSTDDDADVYSENEIKIELIQKTRCDVKYIAAVLEKMISLGLELCQQDTVSDDEPEYFDDSETYNLAKFAHLRNYISDDEFAKVNKKIMNAREKQKLLEKENKDLASNLPKGY